MKVIYLIIGFMAAFVIYLSGYNQGQNNGYKGAISYAPECNRK